MNVKKYYETLYQYCMKLLFSLLSALKRLKTRLKYMKLVANTECRSTDKSTYLYLVHLLT